MKKFIEWLEIDKARTRKVVLLSTVFVFLLVTMVIFGVAVFGVQLTANIVTLYGTLSAFMVGVYGFYTGTSSDKTAKLADKAADIMMKKLNAADNK
jgi:hypothetical protein